MKYPKLDALSHTRYLLEEYARLKCEEGAADEVCNEIDRLHQELSDCLERIKALPSSEKSAISEPDNLEDIKKLRPDAPRRLWSSLPSDDILREKMLGALYGRIIGCLLGVPVEGWTPERIEGFCKVLNKEYPPTDYFEDVEEGYVKNVYQHYRHEYRKSVMEYAPVDDDIIYTQIALLVMERYGVDFTTSDMGEFWKEHLPFACTAEDIAIKNLKKGLPIEKVGETENPYCQWIGAAIRSDGFGYAAAGYPEKAAKLAYNDAFLSHRKNGIYGEMFLAAAQSAAFSVSSPKEAIEAGLNEIPKDCLLAKDIRWALEACKSATDFKAAAKLVDERFAGMSRVHTNNNLCLVVFGLLLGGGDFLKTLSITVAMGMDNDCTAASAGSIIGAITGMKAVPEYLSARLQNRCDTYLTGFEMFKIDDMAERFIKLAKKVYNNIC